MKRLAIAIVLSSTLVTGAEPGRTVTPRSKPVGTRASAPVDKSAGELSGLASLPRPRAGKVEVMRSSELKRGMKGTAWTVFEGNEPEAVPVEIIGLWKNAWGPKQDIILAKMGGKRQRTGVAGGMSGSPVYVDGKLIGAIALRISVFSPDAICGITPIELMLEINDYDWTRPADARAPGPLRPPVAESRFPANCWRRRWRREHLPV